MAQEAMKTQPDAADLDDIQGLVYSGCGEHAHAGYLFATLGDRCRAFARVARRPAPPDLAGVARKVAPRWPHATSRSRPTV